MIYYFITLVNPPDIQYYIYCREVLLLSYTVILDPSAAAFYEKVAAAAGLPPEQVLADALYRLAGTLSVEALLKKRESS